MKEDFPVLILTILLMCGLGSCLSTVWFLFQGCVKSCRISQMTYCIIGGIACITFLTIDSTAYNLSLGSWITVGARETLEISWRFRIDTLAAASLLFVYSSIGISVAMSWNGACPFSNHERNLVSGTAIGLTSATMFFLAGNLYLLLLGWLGLSGTTLLLAKPSSTEDSSSTHSRRGSYIPVSSFVSDAGLLFAVCLPAASLRALEIPEVLALSTMESLYPENRAMIDMIGLGGAIAVLARSLQLPFLGMLPRLSEIGLRRYWLIFMSTIAAPSVFLSLKFFELWHAGSVVSNLVSTLGVVSGLYFGLLAVVTSKLLERVVALSLMAMSLFWITCGFPSFALLVISMSIVVILTVSVVLLTSEALTNSGRVRWSLVGFAISTLLFIVVWTLVKVMRSGSTQTIDKFDAAMAGILLLGFAGLTRLWLQSRFENAKPRSLVVGLEPPRFILFASIIAAGIALPILFGSVEYQNPFAKEELRGVLVSGVVFLLPLSLIAAVLGVSLGWWLNKTTMLSSSSEGSIASLIRIVQIHLYLPTILEFVNRVGTVALGPLMKLVDRKIIVELPGRFITETGKNVRLAFEQMFFSGESLMVAAAVMSIAILSATLIW